jgi:hypothetical protein
MSIVMVLSLAARFQAFEAVGRAETRDHSLDDFSDRDP